MALTKLLEHPKLRKFIKTYGAGEYLFRQGETGNTMFVVMKGIVELVAETELHNHVAALITAGGYLGEKAMIKKTGHPRFFSARTVGDVVALEISSQDLSFLKAAAPELMLDIMVQAFETSIERIENLNFLTRALKSSRTDVRMAGCLLYLCRTAGLEEEEGKGFKLGLSEQSFRHYIDATSQEVQTFFRTVLDAGLIEPIDKHWFRVPDRGKLLQYLSDRIEPRELKKAG